ncbi:DUF6498-containing protein [Aurantivibrio infirmus]
MPVFKPTLSIIALTIANLLPLLGVIYLSWDATILVPLYWVENLIIGFYNLLKIACLQVKSPRFSLGKIFSMLFFSLHFGGFCAVHGLFLLVFLNVGGEDVSLLPEDSWPLFLVFFQLLFSVITALWESHPPGMELAFVGLVISHGISFVQNYIIGKEFQSLTIPTLMQQPYKRIVIMHIAIIAGGFLIAFFGSPLALVFVLVFLKITMDIFLHIKEHQAKAMVDNQEPINLA